MTKLAGRTCAWRASHDFGSRSAERSEDKREPEREREPDKRVRLAQERIGGLLLFK